MIELGAGVYADAHVWVACAVFGTQADGRYETSLVTMDIGLDVHVDVPLAEGIELSRKRAEVLQK